MVGELVKRIEGINEIALKCTVRWRNGRNSQTFAKLGMSAILYRAKKIPKIIHLVLPILAFFANTTIPNWFHCNPISNLDVCHIRSDYWEVRLHIEACFIRTSFLLLPPRRIHDRGSVDMSLEFEVSTGEATYQTFRGRNS